MDTLDILNKQKHFFAWVNPFKGIYIYICEDLFYANLGKI